MEKKKSPYLTATLEVVCFATTDVIATSGFEGVPDEFGDAGA